MNDQQLKEFSNTLTNKMRRVKLTMAKLQMDAERYKVYEKEEKKKDRNISLKNEMKILFGKSVEKKEFNSTKFQQLNTERAYNFGIVKAYRNIGERFDNYKSDFNMRMKDLQNSFETKLFKRNTITQSKNSQKNSPINLNKIIGGYQTTRNSNNTLLPKINIQKNFKIKKIGNSSQNKKRVNFNLSNIGNLTYREQNNNKSLV